MTLLAWLSFIAYLAAAAWLGWRARAPASEVSRGWALFALVALVLHALLHWRAWNATGTTDLHFFAALSLVGLGMAALTTVAALGGRLRALGGVVFPLAAVVALAYGLRRHPPPPEPLDWRLLLHAWLALLAYATLAVAALLAVFLWTQEAALRRRALSPWLRALPPLTELETLLFRTVGVGFLLLTATLLTGVLFVDDLLAQHLVHKTVLSVLSWVVFGALLAGRWRLGWRGSHAARWTLVAMALLVLAFFGTKFVLELVLHRTA